MTPPKVMTDAEALVSVCKTDANNYCRILSILGMEEEGDPVAEVSRLQAIAAREAEPVAWRHVYYDKKGFETIEYALRRNPQSWIDFWHAEAQPLYLASPTPAAPGWIAVSERLPAPGEYWAALEHGTVLRLRYGPSGYWTGDITRDCKHPTHWQEIPEPEPPK